MKKYILIALFALGSGKSFALACTPQTPCLDRMVNIPMRIRNSDDYARIMNAAFVCAGAGVSIEQLKKQYRDLPDPKNTVKDILAIRVAYNAKNGGIDILKPCLEAVLDCSSKPCFDKMKNTQNPEITGPQNYSTIVYDAYLCSGLFPPSLASLEKEYNAWSGKDTWADAITGYGPGITSDISLRTCLNRISPCSQKTPCLSKMKGIKMEIENEKNYEDGIRAAFACVGWRSPKLGSEYLNLADPKKTWADIISKRSKSDAIIPCLQAIKG